MNFDIFVCLTVYHWYK